MNPLSTGAAPVRRQRRGSTSVTAALADQLSRLYDLAQSSTHVFASPLGPFHDGQREQYVPRFVYFGPNSSDVSVRLAFFAGLQRDDLVTTLALLHFIERLTIAPTLGEQLSLSFFPRVADTRWSEADSVDDSWATSDRPEIRLLSADLRQRDYHGFVRLEAGDGEDLFVVRLRTGCEVANPSPAVELIADGDIAPFAVRWEVEPPRAANAGPLSVAARLPAQPFELTFRLPRHWTLAQHQRATALVFTRFVQRYRAFVAYGQHL